MSSLFKKIGIGLLTLVVAGFAFFFLYVVKTPHYSLYQIHKAVQGHDTTLFEQHVDLDNIYSKGIDDLIVSAVKGKKTIGLDIFTAGILKLVKPTVVHALRDATLESVRRVPAKENNQPGQQKVAGQTAQKDKPDKKDKKENSIPLLKKMKERVDVSNLKIKDASVTTNEGGTADVAVVLHNHKLNKDFNVNMRMAKLYNGEWQIKEITNFVEFLTEVEEATKQAAKEAANETLQKKQ